MTRLYLRADCHLKVVYGDETLFGSPVGDLPDRLVRELFFPVAEHVRAHGLAGLVAAGPSLLAEVRASEAFGVVAAADGDAWRVHEAVLYPDPELAAPQRLMLARTEADIAVQLAVRPEQWAEVHDLIARLEGPGVDPEDAGGLARGLLPSLLAEGVLTEEVETERDAGLAAAEVVFLGHNTVMVQSARTRVLVDPLMLCRMRQFPEGYQPHTLRELGRIDAVLLTHSHPDHLDPASVLRLPADVHYVIPEIPRETILSVDMARRLRELGCTRVSTLRWGEAITIGDVEVHALPFHGEQPTDARVLHPEVRNAGNTYFVRTPSCSCVFLADAGRDALGDTRDVAADTRRRLGPVDVVFCGYRGWLTYPVQLLFSSVARYLLFVPPEAWTVRQQLMTGPEGAVDIAERFGARYLVPYADGGAPWHWRIGLGPQLDREDDERPGFDLRPERVLEAAASRTHDVVGAAIASTVTPLLVRPGEALVDIGAGARVVRRPGHVWPFAERRR